MKAIFLLITFLAVAGIYSASAQQKTRDILFPDYANDQAKLKASTSSLALKPVEATLSSSDAIRARIFTNYQKPAGGAAPRSAQKASPANLPSSKAADPKEADAQREALKKSITPKPDQGPDNSPKPKN
jgi:hypothetical protein